MKNYQLILVLKASLTPANRKKLLETVKGFLKGVKFTKEEEMGEKTLAYKIKKQEKGFYSNFLFETEGTIPFDLEKRLAANEDVLRYLVLRK